MTKTEFHLMAFVDFAKFLAANPEAVAAFAEECKIVPPAGDAIGRMVDEATGKRAADGEAFLSWAARQYGEEFLPKDWRQQVRGGNDESDADEVKLLRSKGATSMMCEACAREFDISEDGFAMMRAHDCRPE